MRGGCFLLSPPSMFFCFFVFLADELKEEREVEI